MGITMVLSLLSGVALFLYGMALMGDSLKKVAGNKLELILYKLTNSPIKGLLLGTVVTAIIQSSSATTVMVVGFVNSGMMKLKQAIGIIMGANIGTTVTAWLISLTGIQSDSLIMRFLKPSCFAFVLAFIGILLYMFYGKPGKKDIGTASHKLNALSIAKKWELYGRYTAKTDVSYTVKYLREGDNKVLAPEKVVTDQTFDTEVTEQAADVVGYTPDAPSKTMILDEYNLSLIHI